MKHPSREEWMLYGYGEGSAAQRTGWEEHLRTCPTCRGQVESDHRLRTALDQWVIPPRAARGARRTVAWLWGAAAAAVIFVLGLVAGRWTGPDSERWRAETERSLRQEMLAQMDRRIGQELARDSTATLASANAEARRMVEELAASWADCRSRDLVALQTAIGRIEKRQATDYARLREATETVALLTESSLRQTQQQIVQLADDRHPGGSGL